MGRRRVGKRGRVKREWRRGVGRVGRGGVGRGWRGGDREINGKKDEKEDRMGRGGEGWDGEGEGKMCWCHSKG